MSTRKKNHNYRELYVNNPLLMQVSSLDLGESSGSGLMLLFLHAKLSLYYHLTIFSTRENNQTFCLKTMKWNTKLFYSSKLLEVWMCGNKMHCHEAKPTFSMYLNLRFVSLWLVLAHNGKWEVNSTCLKYLSVNLIPLSEFCNSPGCLCVLQYVTVTRVCGRRLWNFWLQ